MGRKRTLHLQSVTNILNTGKLHLVGYNAVWYTETRLKLKRNTFLPSLRLKGKPTEIQQQRAFKLGLLFNPEYGFCMFL
jgi:hypothetical protein